MGHRLRRHLPDAGAHEAEKAFGKDVPALENVLEIGAGTGYLSLNLMLAGKIDKLTATDISPGMLDALRANAKALKLSSRVKTKAVDAETLPFKDNQFDLVMGHAILHHIPDLDKAFSEFHRVLKPAARLFFAGEPSRIGDQLAQYPKRFATKVAPAWRAAVRAKPAPVYGDAPEDEFHGLEPMVDVHAFVPKDLAQHAKAGGFSQVDILGEELLANWFGWTNRALEATADQWTIPWAWRHVRLPRLPRVPAGRPPPARGSTADLDLLQPHGRRHEVAGGASHARCCAREPRCTRGTPPFTGAPSHARSTPSNSVAVRKAG